MGNFPPVPPNPKKPKTPYEKSVQIVGTAMGVFFILLGIGNGYFLTTPTIKLDEVARVFLLISEYILLIFGGITLGIFMEN